MTALVAFVQTYAIWLYLFCALGILVGIKILADARRLARTTLFSLEQERAGERTFRAIILIIVLLVAMGAITTVSAVLAPVMPVQESPIVRGPTATLAAVIFPTSTPPPSVTPTLIKPTETPFSTSTPVTITPTRAAVRATAPVVPATAAPAFRLPAPTITGPVPNGVVVIGESRANIDLRFQWTWICSQCVLGPEDRFVVVVTFLDKTTSAPKTIGGGTVGNYLTMADIVRGSGTEVWHQAKDDAYQWYVQVKRGEQPLTPASETWKFVWH
ncbi:MAG: hypothetical protein HY782_14705 [Chloroflexi bacterium]|nr:hypothetical protein [Chloroflexota bacterium]